MKFHCSPPNVRRVKFHSKLPNDRRDSRSGASRLTLHGRCGIVPGTGTPYREEVSVIETLE